MWPRGLSRDLAKIELWAKDIAPSTDLRKWYQHDPDKWPEFKFRYFVKLDKNQDAGHKLLDFIDDSTVTLVYGSKEQQMNNAVTLREYLRHFHS